MPTENNATEKTDKLNRLFKFPWIILAVLLFPITLVLLVWTKAKKTYLKLALTLIIVGLTAGLGVYASNTWLTPQSDASEEFEAKIEKGTEEYKKSLADGTIQNVVFNIASRKTVDEVLIISLDIPANLTSEDYMQRLSKALDSITKDYETAKIYVFRSKQAAKFHDKADTLTDEELATYQEDWIALWEKDEEAGVLRITYDLDGNLDPDNATTIDLN
jgi:hypothetical protein